ncbi:MAG: extracellular solute-binding protein, partial [Dehalococcoidia bacterium]|nr:extracellular solute-binding protein [Dehalococcoidia bacterium]
MKIGRRISLIAAGAALASLLVASCAPTTAPQPTLTAPPKTTAAPVQAGGIITVYSGRTKELVGPLLDRVAKELGVEARVRYGDTAQLAAAILEEGNRTPADVFFAQDAGALGALSKAGLLAKLPVSVLDRVDNRFQSPKGDWVGVSGRARVVAYNTQSLKESDLPESIRGFTDPKWKGLIGWPPTNASFQAFVTAMRVLEGEEKAKEWLKGIQANNPKTYPN